MRPVTLAVDLVLLTARGAQLNILLATDSAADAKTRGRDRWSLPTDAPHGDESLHETALRLSRESAGSAPALLEQVVALGGGRKSADAAQVSVAFVGLLAGGGAVRRGAEWHALGELPTLAPRHREAIDAALDAVRLRVDQQPIAFKMLPGAFTLTELQSVYELLLGRKLHKASFRRALHASGLVEATDEWRGEGRGRPAQLFRYAPPRRRRQRRGIRFDLLA